MEDKIERVIRELLIANDVVVVPGFGAFVATDMPAMVDSQNNTIYPPRRKVEFNPDQNESDGIVISALSRQERISRDSAQSNITDFVQEINHSLRRGNPWVISGLGKFIIDGLDNLNFFPDPDQNFTPQSYGLPGIEIDPNRPDVITTDSSASRTQEIPAKEPRPRKRIKAGWVFLILLLLLTGGTYAFLHHTSKGKEVFVKLHHIYHEKVNKKDSKEEDKDSKTTVAAVKPSIETASTVGEDNIVASETGKNENADSRDSKEIEKKAVYTPRTTKVAFEKPVTMDVVSTDLDQFVKEDINTSSKAVNNSEPPLVAENVKTSTKELTTTKKSPPSKVVPAKAPEVKKTKAPASNTQYNEYADDEKIKKSTSATRSSETIYARYQVVASEHALIQNAVEASDKYNKAGYNVAVIRFKDGNFGVCLARSNSRDTAEKQLISIRKQVNSSLKIKEYK